MRWRPLLAAKAAVVGAAVVGAAAASESPRSWGTVAARNGRSVGASPNARAAERAGETRPEHPEHPVRAAPRGGHVCHRQSRPRACVCSRVSVSAHSVRVRRGAFHLVA